MCCSERQKNSAKDHCAAFRLAAGWERWLTLLLGLYSPLQNRAPLFFLGWQIVRCWAACTRRSGSFMSERPAGSFPVRQNWYRSCCYFTHVMPTFRQHCPGGKLVCDITFFYGENWGWGQNLTRTAHHSLKALARTAMNIFKMWQTMGPSASSAPSYPANLGKMHAICCSVLMFNYLVELWWISKWNYWQGKFGFFFVLFCFVF